MEVVSKSDELKICQLQFLRLFNNIELLQNGKRIKFNCIVGNRSRIFKNLENPTKDSMMKLPLIIVQRTGITKNMERLSNINNEVKYKVRSGKFNYNLYTPVPVDIQYQVTIVSKYQNHIDKAIGNFIPFFNKDLYVRSIHPKFTDIEYTNQVVMEDSIQEEHPDELDSSADELVTATCNFTFKTYLFCGNEQRTSSGKNIIYKVDTQLSVAEDGTSSIVSVIVDTEYEGFIPSINTINIGYYPIPLLSTYSGHFQRVDSLSAESGILSDTIQLMDPWVDRFYWKIDESGELSRLSDRYIPDYSTSTLA